jgi:UDP-N-acetylglucosamine 2-epimerase (non-hydrolysing)
MTIVGTRPELIRLSATIAKLDAHFEHILVHTGQNYDHALNQIFFDDLGIRPPDHVLATAGASPAHTIGNVISACDDVLATHAPDAVLILGDTNSSLAAIAAKRRKIPIFHMEAGNRCFDPRVPEEINRRIIDHIADVNLPYSALARQNLLAEGLRPDTIITTGSPMREVLNQMAGKIAASNILARLQLTPQAYFVVSVHREENLDNPAQFGQFIALLDQLATRFEQPVIVSTHPRTRQRLDAAGTQCHPLVRFETPFGFSDYISLQTQARAVLSDSGTLTEESALLDFPALNLRQTQERHEGMEEASVMLVGLEPHRVFQGLEILFASGGAPAGKRHIPADYLADNVSDKIVRIILSYTHYVNRVVWSKETKAP